MQRAVYLRFQQLGAIQIPAWVIEDCTCERTGKILRTTVDNSTGKVYGYSLLSGEDEFILTERLYRSLLDWLI